MTEDDKMIQAAVEELNQDLYDLHKEEYLSFVFMYNGAWSAVKFDETVLWDSENDTRTYLEETNDYEPFLPFIKSLFNEYCDKLTKLKFNQ